MAKSKADIPEYKPSISVSRKDLPEIDNWEVGKEYTLTAKVRMTSLSEDDWLGDGDQKLQARFEILDVKPSDSKDDTFVSGMDSAKRGKS